MSEQTRQTAYNNIDDAAERARIRFYTARLNQMLIYNEKVNEALELLSEINPNVEHYPLINAEARATEQTPHKIAQTILQKRSEWLHLSAKIEQIRLKGKRHVEALTEDHEIRQSCERTVSALDRMTPDRLQSEYGR